ncbi:LLM class flavin-dependent oxidoreductase [Streptomyces sp. HC307]|uniref:LLM class flavin-dependent oxidoreductase n=1 Tax=Streptomyces flavusporus TaxID=3385496 RepID=UPI0039173D52
MELGILSLSDLQSDPTTGKLHVPATHTREIVSYGIAADRAGLDVFALGEHHSADFAVANPAVPLATIAQVTTNIRLTSAVSVLPTLDPVRLHQDFASLDLISDGRAEIIAGRSAFLEAFTLFGIDPADYDSVFAEKLDLLLAIRDNEHVTWTGRSRPALDHLPVPPRPQQTRLPLWLGVGGTPASAQRAGRLGLPDATGTVWPQAVTQTCVVHLIRASFRCAGRQDWDKISRALRPIYTAPTAKAAEDRFLDFQEEWGAKHPAIVRLWENAWAEFVPFLQFDTEIRRVVCTTNATESVNARIRKAVRARGHFPNEAAALKCVYMAVMSLDPTGQGRKRWTMRWKPALQAFDIAFDGRLSLGRR